jgi:homogentisate 1,2-dioxygenase
MPPYLRLGSIPRKRHTIHAQIPGFKGEGLYYEEVVGLEGFSRGYSILYHMRPPTRVVRLEPAGTVPMDLGEQPSLRHHHVKTGAIPPAGDPITGRIVLFGNDDVSLARCRPIQAQADLFRNADADELIFVQSGRGILHTMFGPLPFREFDYVHIPRSTTYRLEFEPACQPDLLVIEAAGNIAIPGKYLNKDGQLKLGAPFSERDLHGPREIATVDREQETTVLIKDGRRLTHYTLASHPFDVVGWDGMLYPFTFNADDFEPITGRIHQPPPVQQTFEAPGFVVCTFAPRMLDTDPQAIKVPYAHSNVQSDEVLYYVRGHFGSRRGILEGSFTLHPRGIPHGPHPGTIVASRDVRATDELAVLVDTFRPLQLTRQAIKLDDPTYPLSWID